MVITIIVLSIILWKAIIILKFDALGIDRISEVWKYIMSRK